MSENGEPDVYNFQLTLVTPFSSAVATPFCRSLSLATQTSPGAPHRKAARKIMAFRRERERGGGGFCVIIRKHLTVHNVTGTRILHKRSGLLCSALQRHAVSHYNKTGVSILPQIFGFVPAPSVNHTRIYTPQLNVALSKAGESQIVLSIYRNVLSFTQLCVTLSLILRIPTNSNPLHIIKFTWRGRGGGGEKKKPPKPVPGKK